MDDNPSTVPAHDAQRELERRALRNVRSLVDNLEGREREGRRSTWKLLAWLLAGMAAALAAGYLMLRAVQGPGETRVITTEPAQRTAPR